MKRCPDCALLVSNDRWLCKCGYEFDRSEPEAQPTTGELKAEAIKIQNRPFETEGLKSAIFCALLAWSIAMPAILMPNRGPSLADGLVFAFFWLIGGIFALIGSFICASKNAGSSWGVWLLPRFLNYSYIVITVGAVLMLEF